MGAILPFMLKLGEERLMKDIEMRGREPVKTFLPAKVGKVWGQNWLTATWNKYGSFPYFPTTRISLGTRMFFLTAKFPTSQGKGSQARQSGKASNTEHGEAEGTQTGNQNLWFESRVDLLAPVGLACQFMFQRLSLLVRKQRE